MIVLIGKTDCGKCQRLSKLLTNNGIEFTKINLDDLDDELVDVAADILSETTLRFGHAEDLPILAVKQEDNMHIICGYVKSKQFLRDYGLLKEKHNGTKD